MPGERIGTGDGNTLSFLPGASYVNQQVFVGGLLISSTLYTYSAGSPIVFLATAFPFSPTPGAPGSGDDVYIFGDYANVAGTGASNISTGRDYTSTELIASVQQRAQIALAARDFGTAQILRLLNEEIDGYLVPFVAQRRLEFWVESVDIAAVSGTLAIPAVAMGGKLRAIAYLQGGIPCLLDQIDLPMAVASQGTTLTGQPTGYYFMGNGFLLFPQPSGGGVARIYYYRRPSMLVLPSQCLQITAFPGGAAPGFFRVAFSGALPTSYAVSTSIDLVSNVPNFSLYSKGIAISATATSTIDLPGTVPTGLSVGDWVCLAGTSPVVTGAPADLVNVLIQEVALKVRESKGGKASTELLAAGLAKAEASAGWTIQQRNDGAMRKLSAFPSDVAGYGWLYG